MEYKAATMDDLDLLTVSRVKVLRAANKLDDSVDMTDVEKNHLTIIIKRHWLTVRILQFW